MCVEPCARACASRAHHALAHQAEQLKSAEAQAEVHRLQQMLEGGSDAVVGSAAEQVGLVADRLAVQRIVPSDNGSDS
jgi:hypothetical protein